MTNDTPRAAIYNEMRRRGITVTELAERLEKKQPAISRALNAPTIPPAGIVSQVLDALDMRLIIAPSPTGELVDIDAAPDILKVLEAMTPAERGRLITAALQLRQLAG